MEKFSRNYSKLSHLSMDSENLNKQTKLTLVESLMIALTALRLADSYMKKKQSDTTLRLMDDLIKQTELTRTLSENNKIDNDNK